MKKVLQKEIAIRDKKVRIYKDKNGIFYYTMTSTSDTYVDRVSSADDAFEYVQRKNNGKLR